MPPTALSTLYCDQDDIEALLSDEGVVGRLDDDMSGTNSAAEIAILTTYARNYATTRVNFYCQPKYDTDDLGTSWLVNDWATVIASRWLCLRRGNPVPKQIEQLFKETIDDMKRVKTGEHEIPEIAARVANSPFWSNIHVSVIHRLRKIRVERPISERTPTDYLQQRDHAADIIGNVEWW